MGQLTNILKPRFTDDNFEEDFTKWEMLVAKYEAETATMLALYGEDGSGDQQDERTSTTTSTSQRYDDQELSSRCVRRSWSTTRIATPTTGLLHQGPHLPRWKLTALAK